MNNFYICYRVVNFIMPKMKSCRGAFKRFKRIASGFKHKQSFTNHILTKKSTKRKRHLRCRLKISFADQPLVERMLPYK